MTIYTDLSEPKEWSEISLAQTDAEGNYTVYLPRADGQFASLYVQRYTDISKQNWKAELVESTGADKTILE